MKEVNVLVAYDSMSGNTEKMAAAVVEGAKSVKNTVVTLKRVENVTMDDLTNSDAIIVGSPTYYGLMSAKVKKMFDTTVKIHGKLSGKVGAAFSSAAGIATGVETTLKSILTVMLVHGMVIQGRHDDKHFGADALNSPDKESITVCQELGKRTAELAVKLFSS